MGDLQPMASINPQMPAPPPTTSYAGNWWGSSPMGFGYGMSGMMGLNPMTMFQSMAQQILGNSSVFNFAGMPLQKRDAWDVFSAFTQRIYPNVQFITYVDRMKGIG